MTKPEKAALQAYYTEADSWANDRWLASARSQRIAWIVAAAAAFVAVCEAVALIVLLPLKTVVPYTLMVDRQTGFVQAMKPVDAQLVSSDTALTQSFLVQYVIAREGYSYDSVQTDYQKVALWSLGLARETYIASMQPTNPASPIVQLSRSGAIDVVVKSVTSLNRNAAMVRFDARRRAADGQAGPALPFVAVVSYSWSGAPMSVADRLINPLGFKVVRYRSSMEAAPAFDPSPTSAASVAPRAIQP